MPSVTRPSRKANSTEAARLRPIATLYETFDQGSVIVDEFGLAAPVVGFVAAFLSAAAAVVWMVSYVQRRGLAVFGWYRIAVALVVAVLALTVL
ncbi:MAG TPA: undecaprenyl-diphosphate phosphatase [Miltoncostaeaceae bacterium]|nr:undecaprenyl-diphosphate phosphatase [Miltoncostaeaceae bacterium]